MLHTFDEKALCESTGPMNLGPTPPALIVGSSYKTPALIPCRITNEPTAGITAKSFVWGIALELVTVFTKIPRPDAPARSN
jgi:hypothetical protein